jgi:hypothetical protein
MVKSDVEKMVLVYSSNPDRFLAEKQSKYGQFMTTIKEATKRQMLEDKLDVAYLDTYESAVPDSLWAHI